MTLLGALPENDDCSSALFELIFLYWALTWYWQYGHSYCGGDGSLRQQDNHLGTENTIEQTNHVNYLRAWLSVPLHTLADTVVLSFTHQQHLLWVIHRQAHLHTFHTRFYILGRKSAYSTKNYRHYRRTWWVLATGGGTHQTAHDTIPSFQSRYFNNAMCRLLCIIAFCHLFSIANCVLKVRLCPYLFYPMR